MNTQTNDKAGQPLRDGEGKGEWSSFLLLAFVGLPIAMGMLLAAYGFVVWFLQIMVFGPPS